jgi:hypothetical protein
MKQRAVQASVLALVLAVAVLGVIRAVEARRPKGTDVQQIQRMLMDGERAAEQRSTGGIARFISKDYHDNLGMSDTSLIYQINTYMRRQRMIDINIPSESIKVNVSPDGKTATADCRVQMATQGEAGSGTAEMELSLSLAKEKVFYYLVFPGEEWRVTAADGYSGVPF